MSWCVPGSNGRRVSSARTVRNTATESAWQYCHSLALGHPSPVAPGRRSDTLRCSHGARTPSPLPAVAPQLRSQDTLHAEPSAASIASATVIRPFCCISNFLKRISLARPGCIPRPSGPGRFSLLCAHGSNSAGCPLRELCAILPRALRGSIEHMSLQGQPGRRSTGRVTRGVAQGRARQGRLSIGRRRQSPRSPRRRAV